MGVMVGVMEEVVGGVEEEMGGVEEAGMVEEGEEEEKTKLKRFEVSDRPEQGLVCTKQSREV